MRVWGFVVFIGQTWVEHIHWYIVSALRIDWISVDYNCKLIVFLIKFYTSDTIRNSSGVNGFVRFMLNFNDEIINMCLSYAIRPPKLWLWNLNIDVDIFFLYCLKRFSNYFIVQLNNNVVSLLNNCRNIQSYGKVYDGFFFADESISGPYVIDLYVFK